MAKALIIDESSRTDPLIIEYADDPLAVIHDGAIEPVNTACHKLAMLWYCLAQIEKAA